MRLKLLLLSMLLYGGTAFGAITSLDNTFVANDQYASDFYSKLNRNFVQVLNGGVNNIEAANVKNDTLVEANMADEINPRVRTYEGAVCSDFVYTGLLPQTGASLTTDITAGTGYPLGYRVKKNANVAHTYTASKWTWVDVDTNGDFHYTETAFGAGAPSVFANSMRLARVSSDTTTVNNVLDMRITSCTTGPFSLIADATGESNLGDLLSTGGGYAIGMNIVSKDATSVYIQPGSIYINGEYRTLSSQLEVPINSSGSSTAGTSGLDSGSVAADTTYYLYVAADQDAIKTPTGIFSTNPTTPSGVTNFRKIGEITSDSGSGFTAATADITTVNYPGKIVQIKKKETGVYAAGTTAIPVDDTIPTSSEGDLFIQQSITPISTDNVLVVNVSVYASDTSGTLIGALFQDAGASAIATGYHQVATANYPRPLVITHYIQANTTSKTTFKLRLGSAAGQTTYFNGLSAARSLGGSLASSITITEYQQ